jgi:hypothetical protein
MLLAALSSLRASLAGRDDPPLNKPLQQMSYLENGSIKVGADLDRGGSIGFLADMKKGGNVVNVHDLGRWIGQSYYSGPRPFGTAHPDWKGWPWNPVSAGDVYGNPSRLVARSNDGKVLYVKSIPAQWALKNVLSECTFETWITLADRSVHVRNRLTNQRRDTTQYEAMDQELPAVYTRGTLHRLMSYTGDTPFVDEPTREIPRRATLGNKPQWTTFSATEHWAALVDDHGWGLGVIHPDVVRFTGGFYGKPGSGGPEDDPNGYMAPVRQEVLDHDIVYEYRYTLVLDRLENIRKAAVALRPAAMLPDFRFEKDRRHWWYKNARDAGQPAKDRLKLLVEQDDPQMYGPEGCWKASAVPRLFVRAAYRTRNTTAELFWETADKPGFHTDQSIKFTIEPDGKMRTYSLDLSACKTYRGTIRRLRFDPVETGRPGETVEIESISAHE